MSRPDHPLSFAMADGVLRRIGVPAGFDLHKNKRGALPGDYIDFAVPGTVAGGHDPVTERSDVINGQDLGSPAAAPSLAPVSCASIRRALRNSRHIFLPGAGLFPTRRLNIQDFRRMSTHERPVPTS